MRENSAGSYLEPPLALSEHSSERGNWSEMDGACKLAYPGRSVRVREILSVEGEREKKERERERNTA